MAPEYRYQRGEMVRRLAGKGVRDERVLAALGKVPRHRFVPQHLQRQAYSEHALPIGEGQTISQPHSVARMSELLRLEPQHTVLEIGTGSGYQTAILAELAQRVYSLELVPSLAKAAVRRIGELGYDNVKIQAFDGSVGWSEWAPYDRVLLTAGAPRVPEPLLEQLQVGGRLVVPEGDRSEQRLTVYNRTAQGWKRRQGETMSFVPLLGRHGWGADE